jgi:hypothetical protein
MAKVTAPLLSFGASGQLAKSLVFATWRGVAYSRRHVIPANPKTTDQQETRNTFSWLNNVWRYLPSEVTEAWNAYASGQPLTGRNGLIKLNLAGLRSETDLTNFLFSPSAKSGPVAASMVAVGGALQVEVTLVAASLPAGWTVVEAVAACIRQQDPQTGTFFTTVADTDATDPYVITLTGLAAATDYIVGGWFKYSRPDGSFAYGPALMTLEATT